MSSTKKLSTASWTVCVIAPCAFTGTAFADNAVTNNLEGVERVEPVLVVGEQENDRLNLDGENEASNRLGLSSMDVPASVQSIDKETIAAKSDYSSLSAVTRATGFASSASPGNGGTSMAVRGFNGHASVAQTYNGNRMYVGAGTSTFPADTWTLERIEVLRGPGSVINGVGAIGATVNYVSKKPTFDNIQHQAHVVFGSNALNRIAYGSGGKINETTAYRFDIVNHQTDGYVDRAEENRRVLAGAIRFEPQDNLSILLSVDYDNIEDSPYWGTPLIDKKIDKRIRKENYNAKDGLIEYEDLWPHMVVEWKLNDNTTFTNSLYYLSTERQWRNIESYSYNETDNAVDRSFYLEILHDQQQWGNRSDFRIDHTLFGMSNRFNIGGEINTIDFEHTNNRPYSGTSQVALNNPDVGNWNDGALSQTTKDFSTKTDQYAIFMDDQLAVNSQLSIVAGLRYDSFDFSRDDVARTNGETAKQMSTDLSGVSWRLGTVYKVNDATRLYAQVSRAQDSIQSILTATNPSLKLATGEQVELGIKQQLFDKKLQYTVSIFDITKKDLLSQDFDQVTRQIGKQSAQGIELEVDAMLNDQLTVNANMAIVNAEYDEFVSGGNSYTGNQPKNVPEKTANLWVNYQPSDKWLYGAGVRYVGERYANNSNTTELPEYTVFDANIQWQLANNVKISAAAKNITDEIDYVLAPYGGQWILADGRAFELGVDYKF